jgi:hypothetical protein
LIIPVARIVPGYSLPKNRVIYAKIKESPNHDGARNWKIDP